MVGSPRGLGLRVADSPTKREKSDGHGNFYGSQKQMGKGLTNVPHPMFNKGFDPKVQGGLGAQASPNCKKCGRLHKGECLADSNACFKCVKYGYQAKSCRSSGGARPQGQ